MRLWVDVLDDAVQAVADALDVVNGVSVGE